MYKIDEVDRLGLEVRDSANFQTIPCLLGRLGSGVRVGASFHIFALTAGARGNCPGGKLSEGGNVRGGMSTVRIYSWQKVFRLAA